MKHLNLLKSTLLLFALIVGSTSVWAADKWVKTAPADLQTGDIVVIVDQTTSKAMSNNKGTSYAPSAVEVTLNGDKSEITSEVAATIQWALTTSGTGESKTFKFANSTAFLYVTKTNNGVRVGSGERNTFTIVSGGDNDGYYLYNGDGKDPRNVGCYEGSDWRCYGSINSNIKGNNNAFYKKTASSGPVDPSVTIDNSTIIVGGTSTISGPDGLSISYSGYDDTVVSVSDAGVVTGLKKGTTTITATWSAVTDTYNAGTKNFEVTVVEATIYEKVTNANQLAAGNEYILVATGNNKAMGAQSSSIRNGVDVTISDNKVVITDEAVAVLTLGGKTDAWTFLASDNNKYLALTSSSNAIHASDEATENGSKWVVTNTFELKNVEYDTRVLQYNSGSPRFACYASSQQTAVLFVKKDSPLGVTISTAKYATFVSPYATNFSTTGITVYTATAGETSVTLNEVASGKVPANTPVVLYKAGADGTAINVPVIASADAVGSNDLKVSTGTDVANMYVLASKGSGVGFYKWSSTSDLSAGKVYLQGASSAREFLGFGDVTGIESLTPSPSPKGEGSEYYNLAGQRVAQPTKGLYIVNGRKVVIK